MNEVTSIPSVFLIKYAMSILNVLSLFTLDIMVGSLLNIDTKTRNLIIFLYALNPQFHGYDSYAHNESFAAIFFPLVILFLLGKKSRLKANSWFMRLVCLILTFVISLSHHFTSYNVALFAFPILMPMYYFWGYSIAEVTSCVLAVIIPATWLSFSATYILKSHLRGINSLLQAIVTLHAVAGYSSLPSGSYLYNYPSAFFQSFTYMALVILGFFALVGLADAFHSKKEIYCYFGALMILYSIITGLLLIAVDWGKVKGFYDVRERIIAFSYLPLAIFAGIGIGKMFKRVNSLKSSSKSPIKMECFNRAFLSFLIICILVGILIPSMVFNAFPRFMYDPGFISIGSGEFYQAPHTKYAFGIWIRHYQSSDREYVFSGSLSTYIYVLGYGQFIGEWNDKFFNAMSAANAHDIYHVTDIYNADLPDKFGRKLDQFELSLLDFNLSRIYSSNVITLRYKS